MENKDEPINFVPYEKVNFDYSGLTKREYAAINILAGFAADPKTNESFDSEDECAEYITKMTKNAVAWTDALFNELDKQDSQNG